MVAHLISLMIRIASKNRLLRLPFDYPPSFPAMLTSVQGEPNVITSTGSTWEPSISSTFPKCFIFGKRLAVTAMAYGSISEAHKGVMPFYAPAISNPPLPENYDPSVIPPRPQYCRRPRE